MAIENMITAYHAKYYAHELTCRHSADSVDRLSQSLFDATVDLNPHQIDAALFALRNPLQQGVLLADEVGLGKTIEAALVLCQYWAERRRKLIIICPASLRKQWSQELAEKFALPSLIIDATILKKSALSIQHALEEYAGKQILIMSYPFAAKLADNLVAIPWDLIVVDEAHKLRNAHRTSNKIGQALKSAFNGRQKLLLTATPLQNSLMELYGLSTLLDEHLFGDEKSFRKQYITGITDLDELKQRLASFSKRTLRQQVLEYIKYTERKTLTQEFTPTDAEHSLYQAISDFLQKEQSFALPKQQRHLISLILRKLLASSPYAILGTLQTIRERLQNLLDDINVPQDLAIQLIAEDELEEEYLEDDLEQDLPTGTPLIDKAALIEEITQIDGFIEQVSQLTTDTKAQALLKAIELGFKKMAEYKAPRKVIIFTESKRTQEYLTSFLAKHGYADKLVAFSGTNSGEQATVIYRNWLKQYQGTDKVTGSIQVDKRTALIDYFKEQAEIMIATEAAAEGVNLQFCALIINYDLPWNPQRVEQRIGRCHRYGQLFDVVVINFLNSRNQADRRVLELLTEKFQLFSGVFGASDEILGRIESGIDFEKRIANIYDTCRTSEQIQQAFSILQKELETEIYSKLKETENKLLKHFDEDVHERLKIQLNAAEARLDKISRWFWDISYFSLKDKANFDLKDYKFELISSPSPAIPIGYYQLNRATPNPDEKAHTYRLNHLLGEWVIAEAIKTVTPLAKLVFNYHNHPTKLSVIAELQEKQGWLRLDKLTVTALDTIESLIFTAVTEDGQYLDQECCEKLMQVMADQQSISTNNVEPPLLAQNSQRRIEAQIAKCLEQNKHIFNQEREKLEKWADDKLLASEEALKDTKARIAQLKRDTRKAIDLEEQAKLQNQLKELEKRQRKQRQQIFDVEDEIIAKRDELIDNLEQRLKQTTKQQHIFTIQWQVV